MGCFESEIITVETNGEGDIIDLTSEVDDIVSKSCVETGLLSLFVGGSTVALTTIEYEKGVLSDLRRAMSVLAPDNIPYDHDAAWGDGNGRSHVKAALIGPSLSIPIRDERLLLGKWQQIVLLELDVRSKRTRKVYCTIIGK
ncbi:YjbQ family protein [Methanoplanus sp. FWC-SCC4]|uniref:YjbQ family protein n=1 Tax=Methanochimaera problematica TaxID=2609417 RepID=A0AA97I4L5_9EURY|nr:secondary thiamine-phosphate synthase enzyme YjbQ [Methanoplanus sp. FWC-SCC4]WOF16486.1 YjbQ family protein [Methanoplanus sp. FWC-SCC4]